MSRAISKPTTAEFTIVAPEKGGDGSAVLNLSGQWIITRLEGMAGRMQAALKKYDKVHVTTEGLEVLDSAGAFALHYALTDKLDGEIFADNDSYARLFALVGANRPTMDTYTRDHPEAKKFWLHPVYYGLVHLGQLMSGFWRGFIAQSVFMGHVMTLIMLSIIKPSRVRWAPLFNVMQRAGLEALPIVAMTNLFVGAVLAFLMVLSLKAYGGAVFAIDFVSIGVMREFAPVIAAVLIAGRSASGFAAEIGSMKMNQEIDAMRVMGIDPYEALVLPRVVALVIMTPLVTFIGTLAGLFGGSLAIWASLGLGPQYFVQRMYDYVPTVNLFIGMIRTPVFAITVAVVGCRLGMSVKDDVISLGRQVTKAVVQSIFLIFMLDALFAMLFNGFTF
jgi:phospholipid/cholesterol/gamma-HCH transport system permease protein